MEPPNYVRSQDRLESQAASDAGEISLEPFLGTWLNTNSATRGIVRIIITARNGGLVVRAFGNCDPSPCDWGETEAEAVYANNIASREGVAFTASYDFGFLKTRLQANVNQGLLVAVTFNRFEDESGRGDYFSREFFHR